MADNRKSRVSLNPGPPPVTRRDSKNSVGMDKFRRMSRVASLAFGMRRLSQFPAFRGSSNSSRLSNVPAPMVRLENTYRMQPKEDEKFNPDQATRVIQDVLTKFLKGEEYNPKTASEKTRRLSEMVRHEVKDLGSQRYKLIVHAIIGQNCKQGIEMASRGLWLAEHDTWAQASYQDSHIFGVVVVYAVYLE